MSAGDAKRVLVVEDDEATAEVYMEWLEAQRYRVARAAGAEEALQLGASFLPDVVVLDLQIPSKAGGIDEHTNHGLRVLVELRRSDPFRPIVVSSRHSGNRDLMRDVMQRNQGGAFLFKDADVDLKSALLKSVAVALESPAYVASATVRTFEALVERNPREEEIRAFLHKHWRILLGPRYRECHTQYPIDRGLKVDLLFIRHDGFPDIWELKRPDQPVFQPYNEHLRHSSDLASAVGQLMEYLDQAEKKTGGAGSYEERKGFRGAMHRPRGVVVIGRRKDDREKDRLALDNSFMAGITIMTYDDLLDHARDVLTFLRDYRNGSADG